MANICEGVLRASTAGDSIPVMPPGWSIAKQGKTNYIVTSYWGGLRKFALQEVYCMPVLCVHRHACMYMCVCVLYLGAVL